MTSGSEDASKAQPAGPAGDEETPPAFHQDIAEWHGKDLIDSSGEKIGKLEDVYVDVETEEAIESLPAELRGAMSNVAVVVEDEPPPGQPLLGLYQGLPLTRRGGHYAGVLADKITIFRGPLERGYGADREELRRQIHRVVLHEIAHHFGISDQRLVELNRY